MGRIVELFRRNKKRKESRDEIVASLEAEGDVNAKLPYEGPNITPVPTPPPPQKEKLLQQQQQQQQQPQQLEQQKSQQPPNWSEFHPDAEEGNSKTPQGDDNDYDLMVDGKPVYIVKQKHGYLSILFSTAQTIILIAMMVQCKVAPMGINPMVGPYPDALNYWGGKNAYYILYDQEYWRLVSPIMLHAGVFHLICNISVQLDTGAFWEREWGSLVWLTVYMGSAVWGSILSVIFMPNSVGVGSSGSVCGLFGAKLAESFCRMCESNKDSQAQLSHDILCEQFGSTLCSVILILAFSFIPYVDWAAHVGGLIGGFVIGIMLFSCRVKTWRWKIVWFLTGLLMTAIGSVTSVIYMHEEIKGNVGEEMEDVCGYYEDYFKNNGQEYECNCMLEEE